MILLPGDLVLFRISASSNWLDKLIGWGQRRIHQAPTTASYCHVGVIGPDGHHMYEARWPRVCNSTFDLEKIQKNLVVEIYRVKNSTMDDITKVMAYCQSQVGEPYNAIDLLTFGLIDLGHTPYCSLLAWRAWLAADRVLCPDEKMVSPDDIAASDKIQRVI